MDVFKVKFTVVRPDTKRYRNCFESVEDDGQIKLYNFPPFYELIGSKVTVSTSRISSDEPHSCTIVARELPQIPRDPLVKSFFQTKIPGVPWPLASMEASLLDEDDSFSIRIPQKSEITSHEGLKTFLMEKYFILTYSPFSKDHENFAKKMKRWKKEYTKKDVFEYFDFPEILSFPW